MSQIIYGPNLTLHLLILMKKDQNILINKKRFKNKKTFNFKIKFSFLFKAIKHHSLFQGINILKVKLNM